MTRPQTLYESASYDLNKFRERRMAERRSVRRETQDRRAERAADPPADERRHDTGNEPEWH